MKVLYDYQIFQMQNYGGISRYFFELMKNSKEAGFQYDLSLLMSSNEYLFESAKISSTVRIPKKFSKKFYSISNSFNLLYSKGKIKRGNYDLFHPTFYETYFLEQIKKPYVLTVHDLINEKFPQFFNNNNIFLNQKSNLIKHASRIITVSQNTKRDVIEHFNISEEKIDVVYLAESISNLTSLKINNLPPKYLLFIGKRDGYKNFRNMYLGIKDYLKNDPGLFLVCAGGGDFSQLERETFEIDKVKNNISYFQFSKNEELKYLYENAICFIFPSLYEGFGIPVLESFAAGCLLCVSHTSSLKEIAGSAALFFDPYSVQEIKDSVGKALSLSKNNAFTVKGFDELKKFNWTKTTAGTYNVYNKA